MNWSVIILGLVALSSVAIAENSYLVIVPKLLKVGYDNQLSIFIAAASQPVEVKCELVLGDKRIQSTVSMKSGETRNATLTLPQEFPVGAGELIITGTGGVTFEERRDVIVYDNRQVILVQTSASTYQPGDKMEVRVVATNEELIPLENDEVLIEIYDANLKLVGEFPRVAIRSGLTETLTFPIAKHCDIGSWLVSATIRNTTSSIEVLVAKPITPSFDLKAFFQRFLLRTDKTLRGIVELNNDKDQPIFGRAIIAIGQITEEDMQNMMREQQQRLQERPSSSSPPPPPPKEKVPEQWRQWKSQELEIAGRIELNYDLLSLFNVDVTKALAVQVYIQVTELASGQERFIQHIIPIFTRDVIYDIRPLEFEAGVTNEFQIVAKRPDGKPVKMEDLIVTVSMIMGNEKGQMQGEKSVEIKDFYTRGRTDIGLFNLEIPQNCIGVLMRLTPLSEDGKVRGYRTHAVPLMPTPRRGARGAKLTIELSPSTTSPVQADTNVSVVSTQISTVGRTSNFYIQMIPSHPVEKFEPLPMSYVLLTNGRITLTGDFTIQPTKECQSKAQRAVVPEQQTPPKCVFNGTLPIQITRAMIPYSTLLVYTFQPSFGFNVAESYRFSVAGLFQNPLTLNATIVSHTPTARTLADLSKESMAEHEATHDNVNLSTVSISEKAQDKSRVELSFTGEAGSTVGLNVFEYDGITQGLTNEITKERLLQYLTTYEQVPIVGMPTMTPPAEQSSVVQPRESSSEERHESDKEFSHRTVVSEEQEEQNIARQHMTMKIRYPVEKMVFGISSPHHSQSVEGDDAYKTPNMGRLYGDVQNQRSQNRRRGMKSGNQYDVSVGENEFVVATSMPIVMKAPVAPPKHKPMPPPRPNQDDVEIGNHEDAPESRGHGPHYGTPAWYEKMHSKLSSISQEAFTFMQSGLSVVTDFSSLRVPTDMRRANLTKLFSQYRTKSMSADLQSFDARDEARQLLEEYIYSSGLPMLPPPIMLEERARTGYYRSIFFNTSRIESQGTGKVVLPQTKPYSTWVATGFALNAKSGLSVAQPLCLPTNQGLFILGNFPHRVQVGEHVLLEYGVTNYLGKDLSNVVVRIRASADFDLIEQSQTNRAASNNGKDYTITIPSIKTLGVETRNLTLVPKRAGVVKILLEVESEFGGDYEVLTTVVSESGIRRRDVSVRLFDLTSEKKFGPIVEKMTPSPFLRKVEIAVSGTGLDRLVRPHTSETNSLVGVDRAIIRLWRLLGLRRYLNETSQLETPLALETLGNVSVAYQKLQLFSTRNGSYSFISGQGEQQSSLYLSAFAFGAMISPLAPVRDNVTINRTLTYLLSRQQQDGSFDDEGPCFHYRFCSGEYRRESLTALVLYTMTRHNVSDFVPEFVRARLYNGENSPVARAQRYLESRLDAVKPCLLTTTLVELALVQCRLLPEQLRQRIYQDVRSRQLVAVPENGTRYLKLTGANVTFDDEVLVNSLTVSLYATMNDWKITSEIARWVVEQIEKHPFYDTVLDAVFGTEAWLMTDCFFRHHFGSEKVSVTVDVTADNGQKQQFIINSTNMDITQKFYFTLPVNQITYTVSGFGIAAVCVKEIFVEKQQSPTSEPVPFQLTNEFVPMPWLNEVKAHTCLTYTPTPQSQKLANSTYNRTVVVEVQIPSGMRLNLRQIGFFLSRVPEVMYFDYNEHAHKIVFFFSVPSSSYGKQICLDWCLERLSFVTKWAPIEVRAYDYLAPENQLIRLVPIQLQPELLGYSFVDAVHKSRPTLEQLGKMQQPPQQPLRV